MVGAHPARTAFAAQIRPVRQVEAEHGRRVRDVVEVRVAVGGRDVPNPGPAAPAEDRVGEDQARNRPGRHIRLSGVGGQEPRGRLAVLLLQLPFELQALERRTGREQRTRLVAHEAHHHRHPVVLATGVDLPRLVGQVPAVDHGLRTVGPPGAAGRGQHVLGRSGPHCGGDFSDGGILRDAQLVGQQHAAPLRLLQALERSEATGGLTDRAMEQTSRQRRRDQAADAHGARRLAEDRHSLRVATERRGVVPHPLERRDLVEQAVVAGRPVLRLGGQRLVGQEAERAQPVVDRHQDDALPSKRRAVEDERRPMPHLVAAAVEPDHDRPRTSVAGGRRPQIEIEAVLAAVEFAAAPDRGVGTDPLPARRAGLQGRTHAVPGRRRLRRPPAQVAHRRRGVGNAAEGEHVAGWAAAVVDRRPLDQT